jgi:hypothetical protein
MCPIQFHILIRHLYLTVMCFGVAPRRITKRHHVFKRDCPRFSSQHNWGVHIPFNEHQNLHFDNQQDTYSYELRKS